MALSEMEIHLLVIKITWSFSSFIMSCSIGVILLPSVNYGTLCHNKRVFCCVQFKYYYILSFPVAGNTLSQPKVRMEGKLSHSHPKETRMNLITDRCIAH